MTLPEPDYISMEEAANRFHASLEVLRYLAEEQHLPVYVRNSAGPYWYAKLTRPRWQLDKLHSEPRFCKGRLIDESGQFVTHIRGIIYTPGFSYCEIFIKPDELRTLDQSMISSGFKEQLSTTASNVLPEDYVAELRRKGENDFIVAARLAEKFPELSAHESMRVLDPQRVQDWEQSEGQQGRPKQWFYYLKKKGERILIDLAEDKL